MIDFTSVKAQINDSFARIADLPAAQVRWRDEAQGSTWVADPSIWMRLTSVGSVGQEEELQIDNGANTDPTMLMSGQRHFTWSISAESFEQNIASPKFAGNVIERIALRVFRWSEIWPRTAFAIVDRAPMARMEYSSDGRMVSCFVLDFFCATVDAEIDNTPGAGGWIETAPIAGLINDVAVTAERVLVGGGPRNGFVLFDNESGPVRVTFGRDYPAPAMYIPRISWTPDDVTGAIVFVSIDPTSLTVDGFDLYSSGPYTGTVYWNTDDPANT